MILPKRFLVTPALHAHFGPRLETLGAALLQGDSPADAAVESLAKVPHARLMGWLRCADEAGFADAPEALKALLVETRRVPTWADPATLSRGGELLRRAGNLAGLVLAARCIVLGYASPGGNKPLMFSGQLVQSAPKRLNETARFVYAVSLPSGALPGSEGHALTVMVRLMHARVRVALAARESWDGAAWGVPINQHDMAATVVLFSHELAEGLKALGMRVEADEEQDLAALWRYVGHVMGVSHEVLPATSQDAAEYMKMVRATQGPPDDDARALMTALLQAPFQSPSAMVRARAPRESALLRAAAERLLEPATARALGVVGGIVPPVLPVLRAALRVTAPLGAPRGRLRALALAQGDKHWQSIGAEGRTVYGTGFELPRL